MVGADTRTTWTITGPGSVTVATVNGVATFANVANLRGGTAIDVFEFAAGGSIGTIDGGAGVDTLDDSALTTARQVALTGLGSVDGFAGTEAAVTGGFSNLDMLTGGTAADTLTGLNATATWTLAASNQYVSTNTLGFTSFETLVGGAGTDTFNVQSTAGATTINAGAGNDVIGVGSLAPATGGTVNAIAGALTINGDTGSDTLTIDDSGDTAANTGNLTATALTGLGMGPSGLTYGTVEILNVNLGPVVFGQINRFVVTGTAAGTVTTINGNTGADEIDVAATTGPTTVNGGGNDDLFAVGSSNRNGPGTLNNIAGPLTINGAAAAPAVSLLVYDNADTTANTGTLTATTLTGLGMASGLTYSGMDRLDVNLGSGANTFTLQGSNAGTATTITGGSGTDAFVVTGPVTANLIGGAGADVFQLGAGAALTGTIDGGAGVDTLDESAMTTARQVTLTGLGSVDGFAGTEAGVTGGFTNVDALKGGAAADTLTGMNAAATWTIAGSSLYISTNTLSFSRFENLVGGSLADTFTVSGASTAESRFEDAAAGLDGWTTANDGANLTRVASGGNPGGFVQATDQGLGSVWYWVAPPKFRGNQTAKYGGALSFDLRQSPTTNQFAFSDDVVLSGGGLSLVATLGSRPGASFTSYTIDLLGANWRVGSAGGPVATEAQLLQALGNVTDLRIRGEYSLALDTGGLDNVVLAANPIRGAQSIDGGAGADSLIIDDSGDTTADTGVLTATRLTGLGLGASGLTYGAVETLSVKLGAGADSFNVQATNATTATTVSAGGGDDVITVGSLAPALGGTAADIRAALTVNGEAGNDTLDGGR